MQFDGALCVCARMQMKPKCVMEYKATNKQKYRQIKGSRKDKKKKRKNERKNVLDRKIRRHTIG